MRYPKLLFRRRRSAAKRLVGGALGILSFVAAPVWAAERAVIFDQTAFPVSRGYAAQDFESVRASRASEAADDFSVGGTEAVFVNQVILHGEYGGGGGVNTVDLTIASDDHGPGNTLCSRTGLVSDDQSGLLIADFGMGCVLGPGHYWLVVQAELDFASGQWFWHASEDAAEGHAMWRNPGGGHPTLCTSWGTLPDCFGSSDLSFVFAVGTAQPALIFEDGFESGSTGAWTGVVP